MTKKYDLVVKVGEYETGGQKKARWKTIGAVMDDGKGGQYAFIDASFNPAGVPRREGSESIMVSFFEPKNATTQQAATAPPQAPEEDIPF